MQHSRRLHHRSTPQWFDPTAEAKKPQQLAQEKRKQALPPPASGSSKKTKTAGCGAVRTGPASAKMATAPRADAAPAKKAKKAGGKAKQKQRAPLEAAPSLQGRSVPLGVVDVASGLANGHRVLNDGARIWDCMLNLKDIGKNVDKYYTMQVLLVVDRDTIHSHAH